MKRTKSITSFQKLIYKYRVIYFLSFAGGFIILFLIIGVALFFTITRSYYGHAERSMEEYCRHFEEDKGGPGFPGLPSQIPQLNDPTMISVVYYVNDQKEIIEYQIAGADFNQAMYNAVDEDFRLDIPIEKYVLTSIDNFYYLSYYQKITKESLQKEGLTGYVKVYSNVNSAVIARERIIMSYIIASFFSFALSFVLGFFMMREGTKPLELFVNKQTNFVSDASHELRTPLAVVRSKIENVLSQPGKTVFDVSEDLVIALNEISRLTKLTQELLTLARNDKDTIQINYSLFDVDEVLKEIIEPFIEIGSLSERNITYEGMSCLVYLDKDKFKQIMIINIDNAIKYTEAGDTIRVSSRVLKEEVHISVADTGIGLSDEAKQKVFDRFYREDKARSRETGGNGLGLSIAYTLVQLQRGRIEVYDNIPKGTRFVVTFPKATPKQIAVANATNNAIVSSNEQ